MQFSGNGLRTKFDQNPAGQLDQYQLPCCVGGRNSRVQGWFVHGLSRDKMIREVWFLWFGLWVNHGGMVKS